MKKNIKNQIAEFLDAQYGDEWRFYAEEENRVATEPEYWPTTVAPGNLLDRASTIDVCMQLISEEKSVVTRVMLAQWVAAVLGGPCDLLTGIALRGYKET